MKRLKKVPKAKLASLSALFDRRQNKDTRLSDFCEAKGYDYHQLRSYRASAAKKTKNKDVEKPTEKRKMTILRDNSHFFVLVDSRLVFGLDKNSDMEIINKNTIQLAREMLGCDIEDIFVDDLQAMLDSLERR